MDTIKNLAIHVFSKLGAGTSELLHELWHLCEWSAGRDDEQALYARTLRHDAVGIVLSWKNLAQFIQKG